jgi:aromatic-L-amino-acid decarboxylase
MTSEDRGSDEAMEFRRAVERAARWIGEFFDHPERFPVLSQASPGQTRDLFPAAPPKSGRSLDDILDDFEEKIVPGITHWNHPSFFAYFSITGSYPGILGEFLSAALNVNGMLWRTSPALTELEMLSLDYVRQLLGLGDCYFGQILDTASTSSLVAMTAARESLSPLEIRRRGMAGRADLPPLTVYTSQEAHASINKAAIVLGVGTDNVRRVAVDDRFRMEPGALATTIESDIDAGMRPLCVVATVGTTATTSVDPVPAIAKVCRDFGVWLHVDAAYAWAAAILPEKRHIFDGCDLADSIVVNPHKWLFTPIDLSVLYCRHKDTLRNTFSLVPEYLRSGDEKDQPNLMDYGFQLGRRFRALKLWMVLNYYGVDGLRERIRGHIGLADGFARWANEHPDFEVMAPVEFSTVCFRFNPSAAGHSAEHLDGLNLRLLEAINASGEAFLSHAKVNGRITLRCAIGNIRTTQSHITALQTLLENKSVEVLGG